LTLQDMKCQRYFTTYVFMFLTLEDVKYKIF